MGLNLDLSAEQQVKTLLEISLITEPSPEISPIK